MIAILLSTLLTAAEAPPAAPPPPPSARPVRPAPPHERPVMETQFAAHPTAGPALSAVEADKLYSLYLGRIGQPPQDADRDASPIATGGASSPQ